jgi:NAD(P)-dependent dehydrogenase (short-subunit alcohol dehydrogenase family)
MQMKQTTAIVTGASQGIGEGVAKAFLTRGYNFVTARTSANGDRRSRSLSQK